MRPLSAERAGAVDAIRVQSASSCVTFQPHAQDSVRGAVVGVLSQGRSALYHFRLVIVTHIWHKLSNIERKVTLIVTHFW